MNREPSVFVDPAIDGELASRGYVVMPLLSRDEVEALLEVNRSKVRERPSDLYFTACDPDAQYRRAIQEEVNAVIAPRILPLLNSYKNCSTVFIHKRAHTKNGRSPIHQDPTFVDQFRQAAVNVWIPLVDVNEDNGCMQVFPKTHSLVNHICTIPSGPSPYDPVMALLESGCRLPVPMAAGKALLYNMRMLHSSGENRTPAERPAVASAYIPGDSKFRFYVRREGSSTSVDVFEADNFLDISSANGQFTVLNPAGVRRIGTEEHVVRPLTADDIDCLRIAPNSPPPALSAPRWRSYFRRQAM
jgi:hypothetical protein